VESWRKSNALIGHQLAGESQLLKRSHTLLGIAVVVVFLAGLYVHLRASMGGPAEHQAHTLTFSLAIPDSLRTEVLPVFKAIQDDTVVLDIVSKQPGEVHVHGYEKKVRLVPGGHVLLSFTAHDSGLFPVHLHETDGVMRALATLEVQPQ
jgi:hypothetical protein